MSVRNTWQGVDTRRWLLTVALLVVTLLAYSPAMRGGFLWDDDQHVTAPHLRSLDGLRRIWFEPGATIQYFPLLQSAFWIEHKLWGDATVGYHLINVLLHTVSALMVALILRRMAIPGAFLTAAIFALHPVHVESVAWMTEQKNTLSAVFYLGSAMVYLRFDQARTARLYLSALGLFAMALLSKSVTATLPGALLVILWWQRGRLSWKTDVLPLVPLFLLGAGTGIFTAWLEHSVNRAQGPDFDLTFLERGLLAGRAIWFYLGKLLWPTDLTFIYPRWNISQSVWSQYLFPASWLLILAVLFVLRRRWRGPLAAALFFTGTLLPVLGFVNVYPFMFSFVADHFQYLASLGIITLASVGIVRLLTHWRVWGHPAGFPLCLILLATLAVLTWRQSRMYSDIETLYRTTIEQNPTCWMAHNNLGIALANRGRTEEAIAHYRKALEIRPNYAEAHNNLGLTLAERGQTDEALAHLRKALEIKPDYPEACGNIGISMADRGQIEEAIAYYQDVLAVHPDYALVNYHLGNLLLNRDQAEEAIKHYRKAIESKPEFAEPHANLASILASQGRIDKAMGLYRQALFLKPDYADAHYNLGVLLVRRGRIDEAIDHYRKALALRPDDDSIRRSLEAANGRRQ